MGGMCWEVNAVLMVNEMCYGKSVFHFLFYFSYFSLFSCYGAMDCAES